MSKPEVTLTFAGDSSSLEKSLDRVGSSTERMGKDTESGFNKVGEGADRAEQRAMGFRDSMTGVQDTSKGVSEIMKGNLFTGFLTLGMGIGDLASGVANFGVQFAKQAGSFVANTAKMVASHTVGVATTIAGWVAQGAAALVAGAQMALAWLIGLGPIALVIVAIAAIIGILAFLGVGFDDIAKVAGIAWQFIQDMAAKAFGWLKDNWPLLLAILTGPFGLAVLAIVKNWDTIKGLASDGIQWVKDRFSDLVGFITGLPGRVTSAARGLFDGIKNAFRTALNWVIGKWNSLSFTLPSFSAFGKTIGGNTISVPPLPTFHDGRGTFSQPQGNGEGLALLMHGEKVVKPGAGNTAPVVNIYAAGSVISERELLKIVENGLASGRIRRAS